MNFLKILVLLTISSHVMANNENNYFLKSRKQINKDTQVSYRNRPRQNAEAKSKINTKKIHFALDLHLSTAISHLSLPNMRNEEICKIVKGTYSFLTITNEEILITKTIQNNPKKNYHFYEQNFIAQARNNCEKLKDIDKKSLLKEMVTLKEKSSKQLELEEKEGAMIGESTTKNTDALTINDTHLQSIKTYIQNHNSISRRAFEN